MAAREEDKAMAGLLRRSLAQDAGVGPGSGSGEDCPEPEILAAYFDRALDAQEIARYDLHFSRCSTCREQLAAMARASGASGAPDAADAEKKNAGAWDWLRGPRWLMPAAAMLAVLLVITGIALHMKKAVVPANDVAMVRPEASPSPNSATAPNSEAPVKSPPSPNSVQGPVAAPPAKVTSPATRESIVVPPAASTPGDSASAAIELGEPRATRAFGATSAAGAKAGVSHANTAARRGELSSAESAASQNYSVRVETPPQPQPAAPRKSPVMDRGAMRAGSGGVGSGSGAGVRVGAANSGDATASVAESAPAQDTTAAPAVSLAKKAEPGSVESDTNAAVRTDEAKEANAAQTKLPKTAAPSRSVTARNLSASQTTEAAALARLHQAQISSNLMNLQIQTPDANILWMVASPGVIEKSEDGGTTWKPGYVETRALILAGAAPTAKICWVVGAGGTILRTTNGTHWKTIRPPVETDFVRVEAADALIATVTAMDGRKFSTVDGGKNWSDVK
jgi:hypothetical protein